MSTVRGAAGITLLELLLVITLLALGAALAAPVFLARGDTATTPLTEPLRAARGNAVRRAETLHLSVSTAGQWRLDAASDSTAPLTTGVASGYRGPAVTVIVSPLGTCGLDVTSAAAAPALSIDPLTCTIALP